jgi:hypothetical protein
MWLVLGRVGQDDAARRPLIGLQTLDDDFVSERDYLHGAAL